MIASWLKMVCESIPGIERAVVIRQHGASQLCAWPDGADTSPLTTQAQDSKAIAGGEIKFSALSNGKTLYELGLSRKQVVFAKALFLIRSDKDETSAISQLLQWSHSWLALLGEQNSEKVSHFDQILTMLERSTEQDDLEHNAYCFCNQLVDQYGFDQALFCVLESRTIKVKAVSKIARVEKRLPLFLEVESFLKSNFIHNNKEAENAFKEWLERNLPDTNFQAVPAIYDDQTFAFVVLFYRNEIQKLSQITAQIKLLLRLIIPIYYKLYLSEMFFWPRWKIQLNKVLSNKPKSFRMGLTFGCVLVLLTVSLLPAPQFVRADARIEGKIQRAVVAPEDGYLKEVFATAGDSIKKGTPLAKLDERTVQLEIERWLNEKLEYEREYNRQLTALDHTQLRITQAKIAQAKAKLELFKQKLNRTNILAPIDGEIIKGDLSRAIGAPLEKGQVLFEMAPLGDHKVVLYVDEKQISKVEVNQSGKLRLSALPYDHLNFVVTNISSLHSKERHNIQYRVEAKLDRDHPSLRPGMQGFAKIKIQNRPLVASLLSPIFDKVRLLAWKYFL